MGRLIVAFSCLLLAMTVMPLPAADDSVPQTKLPLADNRDAYDPAAAFGQDVYLVAWKSGHLAEGDLRQGLEYIGNIVACRLDRDGKVLDARPLVVCSAPDLQERPRVAFGGGVFLVVWQDLRNEKYWDVYATRVTPEGEVLDSDGFLVSGGAHSQALPDVVWDGKAFQVVWQDFRCGNRYEVYGARVSAEGKVLEPAGRLFVTEPPPLSRINPVVASPAGGGKSLLFWLGAGRVLGRRDVAYAGCHLLMNGEASAEPTYVNCDVRSMPGASTGHLPFPTCVAAGPEAFLVAWTTHAPYGRGNAPNDAHAALFTRDGRLEKKLLLTRVERDEHGRVRNPSAAWDGSAFVVAWHQVSGYAKDDLAKWPIEAIFCARVAKDGVAVSQQHVAGTVSGPAIRPAVASDGAGTTLIAYEQHPETAEIPIRIGVRMLKPSSK
jgi:hypothetical protein